MGISFIALIIICGVVILGIIAVAVIVGVMAMQRKDDDD